MHGLRSINVSNKPTGNADVRWRSAGDEIRGGDNELVISLTSDWPRRVNGGVLDEEPRKLFNQTHRAKAGHRETRHRIKYTHLIWDVVTWENFFLASYKIKIYPTKIVYC